jgi:two-component system sensor histidine kinase KdpD
LVATVEEATGRLTRIVTDLLDLSRLQTGALQPVSLPIDSDKVTARALLELPDRERVQVADDLPGVLGDAGLLQRVLVNLLGNALRYADHVTVSGHRSGPRAVLEVADDGPGVAADLRSVMFEPFQRLGDSPAGDGLGLGLAVARGLTEIQGGSLSAHDTPGGGLTMRLELPSVPEV